MRTVAKLAALAFTGAGLCAGLYGMFALLSGEFITAAISILAGCGSCLVGTNMIEANQD